MSVSESSVHYLLLLLLLSGLGVDKGSHSIYDECYFDKMSIKIYIVIHDMDFILYMIYSLLTFITQIIKLRITKCFVKIYRGYVDY